MTAFATITLADSTAANVDFVPSNIDPQGVAKLFATANTLDERRGISLSVRLPKVGGSVARVTAKVVVPVMDSSSPPIKLGECICSMEFVLPKRASEANRADALAFASNLLADASVIAAVTSLESIY